MGEDTDSAKAEEERLDELRAKLAEKAAERATRPFAFRLGRSFWLANALILAVSLLIRLTSPTTLATAATSAFRFGTLSTTNVCERVGYHLAALSNTSAQKTVEFNGRVREFDSYLRGAINGLPKYSEGSIDLDFLTDVYALKMLTGDWCARRTGHTVPDAEKLKRDLNRYRKAFRASRIRNVRKRPSWYIALSRMAMGFTEGMLAPVCLLWRTGQAVLFPRKAEVRGMLGSEFRGLSFRTSLIAAISGGKAPISLRLDSIFAPRDWRRDGYLFSVCCLYGLLICCYALAYLSTRTKWRVFMVLAILTLLYGMGFLTVFLLGLNDIALAWIKRGINVFMDWLDHLFA